MKKILTVVVFLLTSLAATTMSAQGGYQVKGVVVDALGPVIGATVLEQGTTNGTASRKRPVSCAHGTAASRCSIWRRS